MKQSKTNLKGLKLYKVAGWMGSAKGKKKKKINYTNYANQNKKIMTNHFTPPRITAIKKTDNNKC